MKTRRSKKGEKKIRRVPAWGAASGSPFSNTDMERFGPILFRIAQENEIDDVRSIDKSLVYAYAERNDAWLESLREYVFKNDDATDARIARLDRCALLVRSIRVVSIGGVKLHKPQPAFYFSDAGKGKTRGDRVQRGHVLREDALANDPIYVSVVSKHIRDLTNTLVRLEDFTSFRETDPTTARLRDSIRTAIDEYNASVAASRDEAAE